MIFWNMLLATGPILFANFLKRLAASGVRAVSLVKSANVLFKASFSSSREERFLVLFSDDVPSVSSSDFFLRSKPAFNCGGVRRLFNAARTPRNCSSKVSFLRAIVFFSSVFPFVLAESDEVDLDIARTARILGTERL